MAASLHIFASAYRFTDIARAEVEKSFTSTSEGRDAVFHETGMRKTFIVTCDEPTLKLFVERVDNFTKAEAEKIVRIEGTSSILAVQPATKTIKEFPTKEAPRMQSLIDHELFEATWVSGSYRPHPAILAKVQNLTRCRIEFDEASASYIVRADEEIDLNRSMLKLRVMCATAMDELPLVQDFLCSEAEIGFLLQLKSLECVDDRRSRTTLLSGSSALQTLNSAMILVMTKHGEVMQVKENSRELAEGRLWKGYSYISFGSGESMAPEPQGKHLQKEIPPNAIRQWIENATIDPINPFLPDATPATLTENIQDAIEPPAVTSPQKKVTKRTRTAKGDPDASKKAQTAITSVLFETGNSRKSSVIAPPEIAPPVMPAIPPPSSVSSHTNETIAPLWESNIIAPGNSSISDDLLGLSEPANPTNTTPQGTNAAASRRHNTMNQRAPVSSIGSKSASIKIYEETMTKVLPLALSRSGPLRLQVDIGRLLVHKRADSTKVLAKPFRDRDWMSIFSPKTGISMIKTSFTSMLTSNSSDAASVLDLKLPQGRKLFTEKAHERKVTYDFCCRSKGGEKFVVEVSDQGTYKIRGTNILLGAINWHYPKRSWDARLALSACDFIGGNLVLQVEALVESLKISLSEDGAGLTLSAQTTDEDIKIISVFLRRQTAHTCAMYPDILLHLTEVQDLKMKCLGESVTQYSGSIMSEQDMTAANRLWWEASLASTSANKILQENDRLEVGDTATWKPEAVLATGVLNDMSELTQEVVTRIDHVGRNNRCLKTGSGSQTVPSQLGFAPRGGPTHNTFW